MTSPLPPPSHEAEMLVRLIGPDAAFALIEARGGTRVYIAQTPPPDSELVQIIGLDAARTLAGGDRGRQIKVPVARDWRVRVYRSRGMTYAQIARAVGCHEQTVWRILDDAALTRNQLDLFAR